eukprot:CAMPEP_0181293408 /NCGR_PEP_ID=MMETSP1101-20121128/3050_1 /TAXON_ID=46948 /ORGANISM="Rhodomonas abbreviata, Strain Caron Lab Isolate" /LENGTH=301 /DNA_ID=CAMNT_0023397995 /DNA_START=220 /DNA_END=1122 /DNA_ORIENTATION=-
MRRQAMMGKNCLNVFIFAVGVCQLHDADCFVGLEPKFAFPTLSIPKHTNSLSRTSPMPAIYRSSRRTQSQRGGACEVVASITGRHNEGFGLGRGEREGPEFPQGMREVLQQTGESIEAAMNDGLYRLRVQINCREFDLRSTAYSKSLVPYFVDMVGRQLVDRGLRVNFLFNTISDASEARRLLRDDIKSLVAINVLGLGDFTSDFDIMVMICPNNEGNENLRRIEAVERIIYAGPPRGMLSRTARAKYMQRPIVLFNPFLEAIHPTATEARKVVPMFMSDFAMAYFLEPHIMRLPPPPSSP